MIKQIKIISCICLVCFTFLACKKSNKANDENIFKNTVPISAEMQQVRDYIPQNIVIAHRGTPKYAPEATEPAYRWARLVGADYLEADLQLTKDSVIVIMHDDDITIKTNFAELQSKGLFQGKKSIINDLTYEEVMTLDAGSWFNKEESNPANYQYGRSGFNNLTLITLRDLIHIAEGYVIDKRDIKDPQNTSYKKDPLDNGNRPGIYIETKQPNLNPGIEQILKKELTQYGWDITEQPATDTEFYKNGKVNIGNTNGKVCLQTFSKSSLIKLDEIWQGKLPTTFLVWLGDTSTDTDMGNLEEYAERVAFASKHHAQFIGPSISVIIKEGNTEQKKDGYPDLLSNFHKGITEKGFYIHPYSFNFVDGTMDEYFNMYQGMFTNISDESALFYAKKGLRKEVTPISHEEAMKLFDLILKEKE